MSNAKPTPNTCRTFTRPGSAASPVFTSSVKRVSNETERNMPASSQKGPKRWRNRRGAGENEVWLMTRLVLCEAEQAQEKVHPVEEACTAFYVPDEDQTKKSPYACDAQQAAVNTGRAQPTAPALFPSHGHIDAHRQQQAVQHPGAETVQSLEYVATHEHRGLFQQMEVHVADERRGKYCQKQAQLRPLAEPAAQPGKC